MRFYDIKVFNDDNSIYAHWSSLGPQGQFDPGALNVELDIPLYTYDQPAGQSSVRVWGVGLATISQSHQFGGKIITVATGMSKGLPLAIPGQQGIPVKGKVFQAFGNWVGINQSLDLIFNPTTGSEGTPSNIIMNWKSGQQLSDALATTLKTAYPTLKQDIQIKNTIQQTHDEPGQYFSLEQFASYVNGVSKSIVTDTGYLGVNMYISNGAIHVFDGSVPTTPKAILFTDLVGQPTWLDIATVQIHCIMRGDIVMSDIVTLPKTQQTFSAASNSQFQNSLAFSGKYIVKRVRNVGNFRNPNAENWITVIDLVILPDTKAS